MKKKYWYDLSDTEIEKFETEWKNSRWFEKIKKESKRIKPNNGGYYACIILYAILLLISVVMFAKAAPMGSSDEQSSLMLEAFLLLIISFIFLIPIYTIEKKTRKDYIEKKQNEWLLEKHNITK